MYRTVHTSKCNRNVRNWRFEILSDANWFYTDVFFFVRAGGVLDVISTSGSKLYVVGTLFDALFDFSCNSKQHENYEKKTFLTYSYWTWTIFEL